MSVRGVIFDFGGVFVDSPFAAAVDTASKMGVEPAAMLEIVFGSYATDTDHPWHRLERGEVSLDQARKEITALSVRDGGPEIDPVDVLMSLGGGGVRQEMVDFCADIRSRGVRTALLTNNAAEFGPFWRPMLALEELFDDVVDSCEVGMRKPDSRIYELALSRLGLDAGEVVFIDDAEGNIVGARQVGMATVQIGHRRADMAAALDELQHLVQA